MMLANTIGFLGIKSHHIEDDGTGYKTSFSQDILKSSDGNFRPVDLEIAPDGSLYLIDWHNVLIGHMQHSARDPLRDHVHGRIYRITYPSRPLVEPAKIEGAPLATLLENLKLPEYRTRYRTRRELRARDHQKVLAATLKWAAELDKNDPKYEHHLLEALWVTWGLNTPDESLLKQLLHAQDFRARAAAVRVLRYNMHRFSDANVMMKNAAADKHGRVRLEAVVAATWIDESHGKEVVSIAQKHPIDEWMKPAIDAAASRLAGAPEVEIVENPAPKPPADLNDDEKEAFLVGHEIYHREGFCATCHQADGHGLEQAGFPPLSETAWVVGSEERLAKVVLNGLHGPLEVKGVKYPGQVPMTPFAGMLNDEEVAAVLTYVRNSFGNKAPAVKADTIKKVREESKDKQGFYSPEELLKAHPLEK